jgi:hypothetical protein
MSKAQYYSVDCFLHSFPRMIELGSNTKTKTKLFPVSESSSSVPSRSTFHYHRTCLCVTVCNGMQNKQPTAPETCPTYTANRT